MSADSPRRGGVHPNRPPQVVSPQPVSDKSIIDSVAGIINDIVPQAYTSSSTNSDNREAITWARFEYADVNDPAFYPDHNEGSSIPPLLLVLGYTTGVQIWLIAASGEATEVFSWRSGVVRTLRILPSPKLTERAREDPYKEKRPLVAICDSMGPNNQYQNVMFMSLKTGDVVKTIKFKTAVTDILANKRVVAITFPEKIAVFNARNFEEQLTITTCYHSPGLNPNPIALGTRWLAYSEKKLIPARRSSGGSEGEGVSSYTATVLYAAKSLGKGLRGLGETVASSLTGNSVTPSATLNNSNSHDASQPGVVTILDLQATKEEKETEDGCLETIVAHFTAHSEAIVAMVFDQTGALLMTADKRGHDFHVFRIQPHPGGPSLAAVHHLYVLHRGDTTAKVQDMVFSADARWAAVSTSRGTTHVFPVAAYGGTVGVRTHTSPHVVNRLSRFHRSAGLSDDGTRSHSPVSHTELPLSVYPYTNPRLPPYPHPTIMHPLAQIRQPTTLNHTGSQTQQRQQPRQRLQSDDGSIQLKLCACFAPPRAWIYAQRDSANKLTKRAVDSLFIMACHGNLIQYDLEPKPSASVPKEKVCDETPIELEVEAKGQWPLVRTTTSSDICPPLNADTPLLILPVPKKNDEDENSNESRWLSQVEIFTHAGPHRRLWMGPQFVFKTYNAPSGVAANLVDAETVEVTVASGSRPARSNPVNMPHAASRPLVIDGSGSSYEQSPRFVEAYSDALDRYDNIGVAGCGENQLREDLAEAMLETSSTPHRSAGRRPVVERVGPPVAKVVNPLGTVITVSADEEEASASLQDISIDDDAASVSSATICAEEGRCPTDSKEQLEAGQVVKDHTEICAEMRSANEPAVIDSVSDENIEELKENRTLCAEAAPASSCSVVDLDRIGAFRDVPSSPSLCAEKGAVRDCSNVVQTTRLVKPVVPSFMEEEGKESLGKELGYQLIDTQERAALMVPEGMMPKSPNISVMSDDDMVHVDKEDLVPVPTKKQTSNVLSSDDDIEHVKLCDIEPPPQPQQQQQQQQSRRRSKQKQSTPPIVEEVKPPIKEPTPPVEILKEPEKENQSFSKKSRVRAEEAKIIPKEPSPPVEIVKEQEKQSSSRKYRGRAEEVKITTKEPSPPVEIVKEKEQQQQQNSSKKSRGRTEETKIATKELSPPVEIVAEQEPQNSSKKPRGRTEETKIATKESSPPVEIVKELEPQNTSKKARAKEQSPPIEIVQEQEQPQRSSSRKSRTSVGEIKIAAKEPSPPIEVAKEQEKQSSKKSRSRVEEIKVTKEPSPPLEIPKEPEQPPLQSYSKKTRTQAEEMKVPPKEPDSPVEMFREQEQQQQQSSSKKSRAKPEKFVEITTKELDLPIELLKEPEQQEQQSSSSKKSRSRSEKFVEITTKDLDSLVEVLKEPEPQEQQQSSSKKARAKADKLLEVLAKELDPPAEIVKEPEQLEQSSSRKSRSRAEKTVEPSTIQELPPPVDTFKEEELKEPQSFSKISEEIVVVTKEPSPPIEAVREPEQQQQQGSSKKSRGRAKRQSSVSNDMVEIINMDIPEPLPSPPIIPVTAIEKFEEPLTLPDMVEIIDIDALERADNSAPPPDCTIFLPKQEPPKKNKSKRQKKQQQRPSIELIDCGDSSSIPEPEVIVIEEHPEVLPVSTSSWSTIVSRKSSPPKDLIEIEKELLKLDLDANKENVDTSNPTEDNPKLVDIPIKEEEKPSRETSPEESPKEDEKKSDSEPEVSVNNLQIERSSSSEAVVPMDTEEESSSNGNKEPLGISSLSEKNIDETQPLMTLAPAVGKKTNGRSKKKKRR